MKNIELSICVAVYTLTIVSFGVWRSRIHKKTAEDYFLASRSIGSWLSAFSGASSAESGWVLLGLVGIGYSTGISALWLIPGCLGGYLFNWLVLGPKLRKVSQGNNTITVPEVLASHDIIYERGIRRVAGCIILVFMIVYVGAQFNAVGKVMNDLFGLNYTAGVIIGAVIVLMYTVTGGFRASVWTDLIQASLMVGTLVILPIGGVLLYNGSLSSTFESSQFLFDLKAGNVGFALVGFVVGWIGIGLAYPGQPHVLARLMATKSDKELHRAGIIASVWSTLVFIGAIFTGLIARAWLPELSDPENALSSLALHILPIPIAGIIIAAVIAAICSTADSQLLIATSTISRDLLNTRDDSESWQRNQTVLIIAAISAALLGVSKNRVIFDFVLYAWGALGASIGPALIGVLFWPRTSGKGIIAGMIGGCATVIIWKNIPFLSGVVYELVPGFIVGLALVRFFCLKPIEVLQKNLDPK